MFGRERLIRTKYFKLDFFEFQELEDYKKEGVGRHYITPSGNHYPSVTTVIGAASDKTYLDEWRKRVGEEEADLITKRSANRGSMIHDIAEKYVLNDKDYDDGANYIVKQMFSSIALKLDKNLGTVHGVECPLYSDKLRTAGRSDLLAYYNGKLSIIDYKNARQEKKREWILDYFIQETTYAMMAEELFGIEIPQIVTLIAIPGAPCQEFVAETNDYRSKVEEIFIKNRT